jgi:hypothetical protein
VQGEARCKVVNSSRLRSCYDDGEQINADCHLLPAVSFRHVTGQHNFIASSGHDEPMVESHYILLLL